MSIIGFDDDLIPNVIAAESRGGMPSARDAGRDYKDSLLYVHDPTLLTIVERPALENGPIIGRLRARDIVHCDYRNRIYDRYGLVERLSLLDQLDDRWYVLNLYLASPEGSFHQKAVSRISNWAAVVSALVGKQLALTATAPSSAARSAAEFEALVRRAAQPLTPRQVQVCARALMGMSNAAIGLDLGIQISTVSTLRKRAYAAMRISSLNELFARCLVRPAGVEAPMPRH